MSQKKEKYLRRSLEQYDSIARDVSYLNRKVPELERDLEQLRDAQFDMAREAQRRIERRKRERVRRERRRKSNLQMAAAILLAILLAILAFIVRERIVAAGMEKTQAEATAAEEIEAQPEAAAAVVEMMKVEATPTPTPAAKALPLTAEDILKLNGAYCVEIPMPAEDQLALLAACQEFSIPYYLALGLIDVETDFCNIAGDGGNSVGYMQVQQKFHQDRMDELGVTDLWVPAGNFRVGLHYLGDMIFRYENVHMGLMAYNMGAAGASRAWEKGVLTSEYSEMVVDSAEKWKTALGW